MALRLVPADNRIHAMVSAATAHVVLGCRDLSVALGSDPGTRVEAFDRLRDLMAEADDTCTDLLARVATSFVTPLDHRDLHAMARGLHMSIEHVVGAADLAQLNGVDEVPQLLHDLIGVLSRMAELTAENLPRLRADKVTLAYAADIHRLGIRAGVTHRRLVSARLADERVKVRASLKLIGVADEVARAAAALRDVATVAEGAAVVGS
ncbi:MAG: hypothetical protein ACK5MP_09045 [Nostocoides sp.]